ncbi:MAG: hypothetical protein CMK74_21690 [Pseudomonadales bacterium]|nr:hypothetical protein [Pseudomonadales bacterium]
MKPNKFSAHGEVQAIYVSELQILSINLTGPFNLEFMTKYERVVGETRKQIDAPCWGSLVNVYGLALAPMEATDRGHEIVQKAMALGLAATAVILHESEGAAMQRKFWSRIYAGSGLPFEYFSSTHEANEWLKEHILTSMQSRGFTSSSWTTP